ncbi:hypothetical protein [Nitrosopumilus sp.]|uniref:hypothetical protein n=1 Tax=Nitrosopumilus sp. TaxID=2024843 RepID=UPI0026141BDA|nr:hypothetical protein [Nitrosopumilus sp.]
MTFQFVFLFFMILGVAVSPILLENSFAQEISIHQQWKKFADVDMLTCKSGQLFLQKNNGNPACVKPSTYLKLVDRGYGIHNQSIMDKHPEMMTHLMNGMASNEKIMYHWHEMMQNNPAIMKNTMDDWVSQIKENPELLKNMLAPMTSEPELRDKMIQIMKNHPQMEIHLKSNSVWMDSVHQPVTDSMGHGDSGMSCMGDDKSGMGHGDSEMGCPMCEKMMEKKRLDNCSWCPKYSHSMNSHSTSLHTISHSDKMMDMIHHVWINSDMTKDMHTMMLEDPSHMAMMSKQMIEPMLNTIMDDVDLRNQMIELMLEHKDFMNSIRHDNPDISH